MRNSVAHVLHSMGAADLLPLTAAQHGIWLGQQLDRTSPVYWTAEAVELVGALNSKAFVAAIRHAVAECDALHMRFDSIEGVPHQVLCPVHDCPVIDMQFASTNDTRAFDNAMLWMRDQLEQKPELNGTLFSTTLLSLGENRHIWFIRAHHILLDGFGYALLARRVAAWYASFIGHAATPRRLPATFLQVIEEDQRYRQSTQYTLDRKFWHRYLKDAAPAPNLADSAPLSRQVLHARGHLPGAALSSWRDAANSCGTDWTAWLTAVAAIWIYRWSGCTDITMGLPVMGRMGSIAASVPCMFMNIVPLRVELELAMSLADIARRIASSMKMIRPHQHFRYEQLKRDLDINGRDRRLFGPVINIMPFDRPGAFADLQAVTHAISAGPVEDIAICISPQGHDVVLDIDANANAYSPERLGPLRNSLLQLIEQAAHNHGASVQQLVATMPGSTIPDLAGEKLWAAPVHALQRIRHYTAMDPQKIAVLQTDGASLTYCELMQRAAALAHELMQRKIAPGDRVVVLMPRSCDAIAAILGIFYCGAVYVPLEADGPPKRAEAILAATRPAIVVATPAAFERIAPATNYTTVDMEGIGRNQEACSVEATGTAPAYVIYTSGSTGTPNGVEISHGALAHYIAAATQRYRVKTTDRVLQFSPLHFDASIEEILLSLCNGATLVLRDDDMLSSMPAFVTRCASLRISVLGLPTAFWHELVYALDNKLVEFPPCIRSVIIGGEAASLLHVQRWHQSVKSDVTLINTYGPTEVTVVCTSVELRAAPASDSALSPNTVAIGTPLPGLGCTLVDERLQPVRSGIQGELIVFGPQLATCYVDNEALTNERFISVPWLAAQQRAYRTGDIAVQAADGGLHFCGRIDNELKISGQRISTQQVETVLLQHEGVSEACVLTAGTQSSIRLLAFVASKDPIDEVSLRAWLEQRLLAAAVPSQLKVMLALPKNSRGKIDRSALLEYWQSSSTLQVGSTDFTPLQSLIAGHWHKVLGSAVGSLHDDFFSLGGRSLHAITLVNRLSGQLGCELAVSTLYENPGLCAFCEKLQLIVGSDIALATSAASEDDTSFAPLITLQRGSEPALFCIYPADGLAWCYIGLATHLRGRTVYGLQAPGITGVAPADFDQLVDDAAALMIAKQPHGAFRLLGWSSGGGIAHAIAATLVKAGRDVSLLAMMDSYPSDCWKDTDEPSRRDAMLMMLNDIRDASDIHGTPRSDQALVEFLAQEDVSFSTVSRAMVERMIDCTLHTMRLYRNARHPRFEGNVLFFRAMQQASDQLHWRTWQPYVAGNIDVIDIDTDHFSLNQPTYIAQIADTIAAHCAFVTDIGKDDRAR